MDDNVPNYEKYKGMPKIRQSLIMMTDVYNEKIRQHIIDCYESQELAQLYREKRKEHWDMTHGSSKKSFGVAHHRKIAEFPDAFVADFCNKVLSAIYGKDWLQNREAMNHELVKPWWVVEKL